MGQFKGFITLTALVSIFSTSPSSSVLAITDGGCLRPTKQTASLLPPLAIAKKMTPRAFDEMREAFRNRTALTVWVRTVVDEKAAAENTGEGSYSRSHLMVRLSRLMRNTPSVQILDNRLIVGTWARMIKLSGKPGEMAWLFGEKEILWAGLRPPTNMKYLREGEVIPAGEGQPVHLRSYAEEQAIIGAAMNDPSISHFNQILPPNAFSPTPYSIGLMGPSHLNPSFGAYGGHSGGSLNPGIDGVGDPGLH